MQQLKRQLARWQNTIPTGNNAFSVKKLLSVDDLTTNYLVYSPLVYDHPEDNWLLDVELYSEEFRADLISIWMDEMGIVSNPSMRKLVKHYRTYFKAIDRREKIIRQNKIPAIPSQLHMAVMAAICGLKDAQSNIILRSVFSGLIWSHCGREKYYTKKERLAMKTQRNIIYITIICSVISALLYAFCVFDWNPSKCSGGYNWNTYISNLILGVWGSSIISFIVGVVSYNECRRKDMEAFIFSQSDLFVHCMRFKKENSIEWFDEYAKL